jgi:hypothetical protein
LTDERIRVYKQWVVTTKPAAKEWHAMKILTSIAVFALVGCGPAPHGEYTCPELPGWSFDLEQDAASCKTMRQNFNMAKGLMQYDLSSVPVYVTRFVTEGDDHDSVYDPLDGIVLACEGKGLMHAMWHQFYFETTGNDAHTRWELRAFNYTEKFEKQTVALKCR